MRLIEPAAGHLTALVGGCSTGKTKAALRCASAVLRNREPVFYIDADRTLGLHGAALSLGRPEHFWLAQPESSHQAMGMALSFCRQRKGGLLVLDSIDGLEPIDGMRRTLLRLSLPRLVGAAYAGLVRVLLLANPPASAKPPIWRAYCHQIIKLNHPQEP